MAAMGKVLEIPYTADPFDQLNPQQRAAVTHGDGPLLVVAGAGTGKTRVITQRIRYLFETYPDLTGENILGLTYTRKAAGEMKQRVITAVGERARNLRMSTFHSFCFEILSDINPALRLLDDVDHWILLRRNIRLLELREFRQAAEPGKFLDDFVEFFSRCQDELVTPQDYQQYVDGEAGKFEAEKDSLDAEERAKREGELRRLAEVARAYRISDQLLREKQCLTYGASLLEAVMQLRTNDALRELLRERFRHVLVDEFQDTNIAQLELLWLLAGGHRNIVVVGDDDQAIYRFRGASFSSFQLFAQKFMGRAIKPKRPPKAVALLTRNYRSRRRILAVASQVIGMNADRMFPDKRLDSEQPPGDKIRVAEFEHAAAEAWWVAGDIEKLHGRGHAWKEFSVLYRIHAHRDALVAALRRRKIPFVIRRLPVLNNRLVRDVVAYLRLVVVPSDNVACARVLAMPAWGLEPADLVRLCERTGKGGASSLWEAAQSAQGELPFRGPGKKLGELTAWIESLRRRSQEITALEFLREFLSSLGLVLPADDPDRPYLDRLVEFVDEWERKSEAKELREFVHYLALYLEAGGSISVEEEPERDAVQLMTVHGAKGLEFDRVYVLRLCRRAFPLGPRKRVLEFPQELMKEVRPQGDFHIQEERRLFYVALTRARHALTLTTVVNKYSKPSEFLTDILGAPELARRDVDQSTPRVSLPPEATTTEARPPLFGPANPLARAYSRIGAWAETYRPPVYEPLRLSATGIENFDACPMRYLLEHVWGVRGAPRAVMTFGNVMHATIREVVKEISKDHRMSFDDVTQIYEREWRSAGFADDYHEEEYKKDGLEQLRAFYERYVENADDVLYQEKWVELPAEEGILITGRIDQVNRLAGKSVEILDYKTGRTRDEKAARQSAQLNLYALAMRELHNLNPSRLTFHSLSSNTRVSAAVEEKRLDRALAQAREVANDIRAGHFPAEPGFACRYCDFVPVCPAHEHAVTSPD